MREPSPGLESSKAPPFGGFFFLFLLLMPLLGHSDTIGEPMIHGGDPGRSPDGQNNGVRPGRRLAERARQAGRPCSLLPLAELGRIPRGPHDFVAVLQKAVGKCLTDNPRTDDSNLLHDG